MGSLGFAMAGRVALTGNPFNYFLTYKAMFTYTRFLWKGDEKDGDGQAIGKSPCPTEGQVGFVAHSGVHGERVYQGVVGAGT